MYLSGQRPGFSREVAGSNPVIYAKCGIVYLVKTPRGANSGGRRFDSGCRSDRERNAHGGSTPRNGVPLAGLADTMSYAGLTG